MNNEHRPTVNDLAGKTALVTGASSGFGAEFAHQLAAMGCNLVITARRADRLEALKSEILRDYGLSVDVIVHDLGQAGAAERLYAEVQRLGREIEVLINNAGFGLKGRFLEIPLESQREMVNLNAMAVFELTWLFARPMVQRGAGYILYVTSVAEFQPSPSYATYAATKAFVSYVAHALHYELHGTGVNSTVVAPGTSPTEFGAVANQGRTILHRLSDLSPEEVVRQALEALLRGDEGIVPGWPNRLMTTLSAFSPRRLRMWSADLLVRD